MDCPNLVPAIPKIQRRLQEQGLSVNAFERAVKLGTGVGSRLLRGEYRPKIAAVLRIQAWSQGDVTPPDWLTPEETAAQVVVEQAAGGPKKKAKRTRRAPEAPATRAA